MGKKEYSTIYKIMHWSIAFCMLFLLLTIFLRLTWMNKNNVADIMQKFMAEKQVDMSRDDLVLMAKKIRQPMWIWHIYIGYVLVGLYAIRLALPLVGQMKFSNPFQKSLPAKVKFQFWVYIVFYICVGISLVTGLFLEFGPENLEELMEEIHVLSLYYLLGFIVLHFGGILMAELTTEKGLVSRIIGGSAQK